CHQDQSQLRGISSWILGQGFNLIPRDGPQEHTFTISAEGPFGSVPPISYVIDLADWKGQQARATGTLSQISKSAESITAKVAPLRREAATLVANPHANNGSGRGRTAVESATTEDHS